MRVQKKDQSSQRSVGSFLVKPLNAANQDTEANSRAIWMEEEDVYFTSRVPAILDWMASCLQNHPECRLRYCQRPTRLIDVSDAISRKEPRLIESRDIESARRLRYLTLSHCWGAHPENVLRTTHSNIDRHREAIPMRTLPPTYRDAIKVARYLGLRYIWIDSICIIQDSLSDWQHEASQMGSIFRGSYLTLAATDGSNASSGLHLDGITPALRMACDFSRYDEVAIRRIPDKMSEVNRASINTRAWTMQELILSKRTLHFTKRQMYWQCHTRAMSEDGYVDEPGLSTIGSRRFSTSLNLSDKRAARQYWQAWTTDYRQRRITRQTDRLPALAGITEYFAEKTSWTPALGLWLEKMPVDLRWVIEMNSPEATTPQRSAVPNMPSWTWLAWEHPTTVSSTDYESTGLKPDMTVLSYDAKWSAEPYASQLTSAHLVLRGKLSTMRIRRLYSHGNEWQLVDDYPSTGSCFLDPGYISQSAAGDMVRVLCLCLSHEVSTGTRFQGVLLLKQASGDQSMPAYCRMGAGAFNLDERSPFFANAREACISLV